MSDRTLLKDGLYGYVVNAAPREDDILTRLRAETREKTGGWAAMQIGPDQGAFMQIVARLLGARKCLEVGTFTGTSALIVSRVLPDDGRLIACDVSEEWTSIARPYWEEAGVVGKIDLRLAPALETLDALIAGGEGGTFDMIFLDGDKQEYDDDYERGLQLLRPGGVMLIDNVLWGGAVADPEKQDDDTKAIRLLNDKVRDDRRVMSVLASIGDGLTIAVKN